MLLLFLKTGTNCILCDVLRSK